MKQYSVTEARIAFDNDVRWLTDAGFIDDKGNLTEAYTIFMKGQLRLAPEVEINILRRLERLTDLAHHLDGIARGRN